MRDDKPYNFLVLEDNMGDYVLLEEYISENAPRSKFIHCVDYKSFKVFFPKQIDDFDLIFMDLSLPDIGNIELIDKIKPFANLIPIIILTGYTDLSFSAKTLSAGITDYLLKDTLNPILLQKSIIYSIERNKYLKKIKLSEKRYSDLFDLSPAPIIVYSKSDYQILDVNKTAIYHYQYTKDELLNMNFGDLFLSESVFLDFVSYTNNNKNVKPNKLKQNEKYGTQHCKKDQTLINVEVISNTIDYKDTPAEVVVITDVTEKLKQLKAIRVQNRRLRQIAWKQSHIVRAPIARLLGIINLLQTNTLNDIEHEMLLKSIYSTSMEIDQIIEEIVSKSQSVINIDKKSKTR